MIRSLCRVRVHRSRELVLVTIPEKRRCCRELMPISTVPRFPTIAIGASRMRGRGWLVCRFSHGDADGPRCCHGSTRDQSSSRRERLDLPGGVDDLRDQGLMMRWLLITLSLKLMLLSSIDRGRCRRQCQSHIGQIACWVFVGHAVLPLDEAMFDRLPLVLSDDPAKHRQLPDHR